MKLYSKEVKVETRKINCNVTQEMIDDLRNMRSFDDIQRDMEREYKQEIRRKKINQINKISDEE